MITKPRTLVEETVVSAKYFPHGKITGNVFNPTSKLFAMIKGYTEEFLRSSTLLNLLLSEFNIYSTTELITEWETAVGIPDVTFANDVDIALRRNQVIAKIKSDGIQTLPQLQALVTLAGFDVTVSAGGDEGTDLEKRFTLFVTFNTPVGTFFPKDFPWVFAGDAQSESVRTFIESLAPANCRVLYQVN